MRHNRSVPPATVVPVLSYPDVRAAVIVAERGARSQHRTMG